MRVVFVTEGTSSAQSVVHRVAYMKESLLARGDEAEIFYGTEGTILGHRFQRASIDSIIRTLLSLSDIDALVVHRAADPATRLIARIANKLRVPIMFDFDDAIHLRWNILSAGVSSLLRRSDAVSAGSHALAQYSALLNSNVHLVPSPVDTGLFQPPKVGNHKKVPTIGWMGDGRVHARNLETIVEPLLELAAHMPFRLKLVSALGNPQVFTAFRRLERCVEVDYGSSIWRDITEIPEMMADFDISVMPLIDTGFNRGKAGQKLLESMAMGIPVVASPVGENNYIVSHGKDGFLASSGAEWTKYLAILIEGPELRSQMGEQGREKVLSQYSRDVCFRLFIEALSSAVRAVRHRGEQARNV